MNTKPASKRVAIVGNGIAGLACARALAADGRVEVILIGPGRPFDRPPLSKRALQTARLPWVAETAELEAEGIRVIDGLAAIADLDGCVLAVTSADGVELVAADAIVWATGLAEARPPIPGLERAHSIATADGLARLLPLVADEGRSVVVIGAGLIGTEAAATLAARHSVTLVDGVDAPLARLGHHVGGPALRAIDDAGVRFIGGALVASIGDDCVQTSAGPLDADVVVAALGTRPTAPEGLAAADRAGIDVDECLRVVDRPGWWACGDVARAPHARWGSIVVPHWDNARAGGLHIAATILDGALPFHRDPYWFSDIGRLRIQQVGLSDAAVEWRDRDGLIVGHADDGTIACALLLDQPTRLREARALLAP